MFKNLTWTTKDGRRLKLSEMSDRHLANTARYLREKARGENNAYWAAGSMLQGEAALDAWDSQMDQEDEKYNQRIALAEAMEAILK